MTLQKTVGVLALALFAGFLRAAETNAVEAAESTPPEADKPADPKFERYRTIMDRMPFGPEPANFNPDAPGTAGAGAAGTGAMDPAAAEAMKSQEEQQILASVRVSALNVTPSGKIAVGFVDSSKQPAGTYYLKVGETRDGWTVKSADARDMKVTLEKDGVEATLALGEGSDGGQDAKKGGGNRLRPQLGQLNRAGLLRARTATADMPAANGGGSAFANLRARRAQKDAERREEAERQAAAAEQAKADRERAAAEREQQRMALLQIQEELRRQREAKEQQNTEAAGQEQNAEAPQE
ncbi:MAG: hypothetical protein ACI4RA_10545 [Kiritimatiellia bacterium]